MKSPRLRAVLGKRDLAHLPSHFMRSKRRMTITAEGWYFLFVLAFVFTGAVLREINLMLVLAGMMLGAMIYNARAARRATQHLTVRRRLPEWAAAGEPLTVELTVDTTVRAAGFRLVDRIVRSTGGERSVPYEASTTLADALPDQPLVLSYRLVFARRGEYRFGPLELKSAYPFGLVRRTVDCHLSDTLVVLPRLGVLSSRFSAIFQTAIESGRRNRHQNHVEGDFYGLRDYRSGDSRRHIHWRTSARRGKLMVRQFERAVYNDVAVAVDLWQPAQATAEDREHIERAVYFAATLIDHICRRGGARVWLGIEGERAAPLEGAASASLARDALVRLAMADPRPNDPGTVVTAALAQAPRRAVRVLVTTRPLSPGDRSPFAVRTDAETASSKAPIYVATRHESFGEWFESDLPVSESEARQVCA